MISWLREHPPSPEARDDLTVFAGTFALRLAGLLLFYLAIASFAPEEWGASWRARAEVPWLDGAARWDSGWYNSVVKNGYHLQPGERSNVAFFPAYPLLLKLFTPVFGGWVEAGLFISMLCSCLGCVFLSRLMRLEGHDPATAHRAAFYAAIFPTALFFNAVYTEGLFFLAIIAATYFARRQWWLAAAVAAGAASGTRFVGVTGAGVVGLEWMRAHGWTFSQCFRREAWLNLWQGLRSHGYQWLYLLPLSLFGLLAFMLHLRATVGDPFAFVHVQEHWGRSIRPLWEPVIETITHLTQTEWMAISDERPLVRMFDFISFVVVLAASITAARMYNATYALLALGLLLIPASTEFTSLGRYVLVIFPLFMVLARLGRNTCIHHVVTTTFLLFFTYFSFLFSVWKWAG